MSDRCECPPGAGADTCDLQSRSDGGACPSCGGTGKRVDTLTLKGLLAVPLTEIRHEKYFFCRAADCPVVYFSAEGGQQFTEAELRERVYQKHPSEDGVLVCYCFRHTAGSVRAVDARARIVDSITKGIQRGLCACDIRNPQGSCCLGNVRALPRSV